MNQDPQDTGVTGTPEIPVTTTPPVTPTSPNATPPAPEPVDLAELAGEIRALVAASPRAIAWRRFVASEVEPLLAPSLVTPKHAAEVRRVLREVEALRDDDGEPLLKTTADLTLSLVAKYLESMPRGQSPYTARNRLRKLSMVCNLAVANRRLAASPFGVRPIRKLIRCGRPQGKRHLDLAELRRLLEALGRDVAQRKGWSGWRARRLQALVSLVMYTGLRRDEALHLQVQDLDIPARMIRLEPHNKAGEFKTESSAQSVAMPEALIPILEEWLAHRMDAPEGYPMPAECPWVFPGSRRTSPWREGSPGYKPLDRLQRVARRAGLSHVTFHALRRSLSTHMEAFGVGVSMIQRCLRHATASVTETFYRQQDEENMRQAVRDITF
jgi:integrase